jgi:pheromone shutdown protein TraB
MTSHLSPESVQDVECILRAIELKEVWVIRTSHLSLESVQDVECILRAIGPDNVKEEGGGADKVGGVQPVHFGGFRLYWTFISFPLVGFIFSTI